MSGLETETGGGRRCLSVPQGHMLQNLLSPISLMSLLPSESSSAGVCEEGTHIDESQNAFQIPL